MKSGPGLARSDERPVLGPLAWIVAIVSGAAASIQTFGSGLLLNWDQVIGPTIPVPPGFWGLGSELPRRVPFYGPLAAVSGLIGGPNTVAILMWIIVVVACLGVVRLCGGGVVGIALGVVYGLSPFLLSRLAIGHLPLAAAVALLPHAVIDLRDVQRRRLWAVVFGLTGSSGTLLGLVPLTIAVMRHESGSQRTRSMAVLMASQMPWVVPGIVVLAGDGALPASASALFRTRLDGLLGAARAVAGGGLFLTGEDVAARSPLPAAVLGLVLLLGVVGLARKVRATDSSSGLQTDLVWMAFAGAALFLVPTLPGVAQVWDVVLIGPLAIIRETHKFWPLFALPLIVGVARVLETDRERQRVAGRSAAVALAVLTIGASWSGLWGADGRLRPQPESAALAEIRAALAGEDHVVLALPWERYGPSVLADGRTVLEPAPWLVEGEVIASGRAFLTTDSDERASERGDAFAVIDERLRAGSEVADDLRALGVDRVVVLGSFDAPFYRRLGREAGVEQLVGMSTNVDGGELMLFAIDSVLGRDGSVETRPRGRWLLVLVAQFGGIGAAAFMRRR